MMKDSVDPLTPLLSLEGTWHGEGHGPYGRYDFEARGETRGRWLLLTGSYFVPATDTVTYVSTQVYGYDDDDKLVLQFFDTAGTFEFHGAPKDDGLVFDWKDGQNWKRSEHWPGNNGEINFRYQSMETEAGEDPLTFEGVWRSGERPTTGQ